MTCEYPDCDKPLDERWQPSGDGAKLCKEHADEMNSYIDNDEIGKMLEFGFKVINARK